MMTAPKPGDFVALHGLEARPELNGRTARIVRTREDGRLVVQFENAKVIAVKPSCVAVTLGPSPSVLFKDEVFDARNVRAPVEEVAMFEATQIYISRNPEVRRMLSERVRDGFRKKGRGALDMNIYDVDCLVPTYCKSADHMLSPKQCVWRSEKELEAKFGRMYTNGYSLGSSHMGLHTKYKVREYRDIIKRSNLWAGWKRQPPGQKDCRLEEIQNEWFGLTMEESQTAVKEHFVRRLNGEQLPFAWKSELERFCMTQLHLNKRTYSVFANQFGLPSIDPMSPLWLDWDEMGGYEYAFLFPMLCFRRSKDVDIQHHQECSLDGWTLVQTSTMELWNAQDVITDKELANMSLKCPEVLWAKVKAYKGGLFKDTIVVIQKKSCANPVCQIVKTRGDPSSKKVRFKACARCRKASYCSTACQKADWKEHKLQCVPIND